MKDVSFEQLFAVPPRHDLELSSSRSRGGLMSGVYWEHKEYDAEGRWIARYRAFSEAALDGRRRSGWQKYSPSGVLLVRGSPFHTD